MSTATFAPASRALATSPAPAPSPAPAAPLSDEIAARRRLLGISGLHLATLARVSPYALSYAEKGHKPLSDGQRARIEEDPANPEIVLTVRGFGYRLAV